MAMGSRLGMFEFSACGCMLCWPNHIVQQTESIRSARGHTGTLKSGCLHFSRAVIMCDGNHGKKRRQIRTRDSKVSVHLGMRLLDFAIH